MFTMLFKHKLPIPKSTFVAGCELKKEAFPPMTPNVGYISCFIRAFVLILFTIARFLPLW